MSSTAEEFDRDLDLHHCDSTPQPSSQYQYAKATALCARANALVRCVGQRHWAANAGLALLVRHGVQVEASLRGLWVWLVQWLQLSESTAALHLLALALSTTHRYGWQKPSTAAVEMVTELLQAEVPHIATGLASIGLMRDCPS